METIDSRPLLAEELTVLRKYAPSPLLSLGRTLAAGGFFSLLFPAAVLALSKYVEFVRTLEPLLFVAFAIWIASQMLNMWRSERKRSEILRTDLKGGTAEIRRYEATDAIRVEETEDEGTGFFLKLKDGRTLFLSGQHFYELEEEQKFPCASFEVVHTPHAKWFLGFNCTGSISSRAYGVDPSQELRLNPVKCLVTVTCLKSTLSRLGALTHRSRADALRARLNSDVS